MCACVPARCSSVHAGMRPQCACPGAVALTLSAFGWNDCDRRLDRLHSPPLASEPMAVSDSFLLLAGHGAAGGVQGCRR